MSDCKIYLRADGGQATGLGHIFRCLAVAEILKDDGEIIFLSREMPQQIESEVLKYCRRFVRLESADYNKEATDIRSMLRPQDIIVCDGYNFRTNYQKALKASGAMVVCIDDIYDYHFVADVVINHAGGLTSQQYSYDTDTRLYLGPSYSIVRSEFWNKPSLSERMKDHVFVCLGGADPNNDLLGVLQLAIERREDLTYHVVTGSAYKYEAQLQDFISNRPEVHHHKSLEAGAMKSLMQRCDIAICSPSTVSYEYLSIGGELYLNTIADNQKSIFNYFAGAGLAYPLNRFGSTKQNEVERTLENQDKIFDGKSYLRIREAIIYG